jgi:hypothetical protein
VEQKSRKAAGKVASRMLLSEIMSNELATKLSLKKSTWAHLHVALSVDEWERRRESLATVLSDVEWKAVEDYYSIAVYLVQLRELVKVSDDLEDQEKQNLEKLQPKCSDAKRVISKYAER